MIIFDHVTKYYGSERALENASFSIEEGEIVCVIGPSGAGKTTLLKALWGEIKIDGGSVSVNGYQVSSLSQKEVLAHRRRLGVVFQDYKLLSARTVYENIAFALEIDGEGEDEIEESVQYVLEMVDLASKADAFPADLSEGERQRVAIARALARQPEIFIADEPTGNLDPAATQHLVKIFKKINEVGTTVIVTTHDPLVVELFDSRVIGLDEGKIVRDEETKHYHAK